MLAGVTALMAALAVVLTAALVSGGGNTARKGCVTVALAYSTGGDRITRCGSQARALCAGAGRPGGVTGAPGRALARTCRRAGLAAG